MDVSGGVPPETIAATFEKMTRKDVRERFVSIYLVRNRIFDSTHRTFATCLLDAHAHHLDDETVQRIIRDLDVPDDRKFLTPWAALIGCYHDHPLWPSHTFVQTLLDRCYDELCAEGHIVRRS